MSADNKLNSIEEALQALQQGKLIILVDDEDRENEGDLILAAEHATAESINFLTQQGRGLVCMPMTQRDFQRLNIPMMRNDNQSKHQTPFGVSIGAAAGITTGISAADRAETIRVAANPKSTSANIVKPGHIFPLCARENGVLERAGHTEGSVDLMRLAGLQPAAVLCEILNPDGSMARLPALQQFAAQHQLPIVSIADLIDYRLKHEKLVKVLSSATLQTDFGDFEMRVYQFSDEAAEHVVLMRKPFQNQTSPLVRVHSECLTGDVFSSQRCDCGQQLKLAMQMLAEQGGVLVYLRQEGRGIGLANKIKAYALQEKGFDTVTANHELGFDADLRDYGVAAQILKDMGVENIRLLTNNPHKVERMEYYGIRIDERCPLHAEPTSHNYEYLKTKVAKLGHQILDTVIKK